VTLLLAVVFPIAAAGVQHQALLKRHMQFRRYALTQLTGTVAGAVVSITMAVAGAGYWALAWQSLATTLAGTLSAWLCLRWWPGPPRRAHDLRAMLGFGGRLTAHGMVSYLETNLDKLLLGRWCGATPLGLYATCYTLVGRIVTLAAHSVGEAALPAMSRTRNAPSGMTATYRRLFQLTCLIGLAPCAVGILWTADVIAVVLGARWLEAVPILRLLFIGGLARMLAASTGWVYVASSQPGRMLRWELIQAPLLAVAYVAGVSHGALGVAAAYAVGHVLLLPLCWAYCLDRVTLRPGDVFGPFWRPFVCTVLASVAGAAIDSTALRGTPPGVGRLSVLLVAFTATFGTAAVLIVPLAGDLFRRVLGELRARVLPTPAVRELRS
jgi:polysaccharide transporter, PST family